MSDNNILLKMTNEKNKLVKDFISKFLGHEASREERKEFTIMHSLGESKVYFKQNLIGRLKFNTQDTSAV